MATVVRCPECQRKNRIPAGGAAKARCGVCKASLMPVGGGVSGPSGPPAFGDVSATGGPPGFFGAPGAGTPWGPGGPGGAASPFGGGDPSGARMRQRKGKPRTPSTGRTGPGPSGLGDPAAQPGDPAALLMQRWDELLRLVPPDLGLSAALGHGAGPAADPMSWISAATHVPRDDLEQVRQVRNGLASKRPPPDDVLSRALSTVDQAIAVLGRTRLPE